MQQQQPKLPSNSSQRKTYDAMIADLTKAADIQAKLNSYSHDAKVRAAPRRNPRPTLAWVLWAAGRYK